MIEIIEPSLILKLTKDIIINECDKDRNLTYQPYVKNYI